MKRCFFCRTEMSQDTKKCPTCGRRYIPKIYLIVAAIVVIFLVIGIFSNQEEDSFSGEYKPTTNENSNNYNNNNNSSNNSNYNNSSSINDSTINNSTGNNEIPERKVYHLNEPVIIKTSEGTHELKFTNVTETTDRNRYSEQQADRVVILSYEYRNIDSPDTVYIFSSHFKVYDSNSNSLETYPVSTKSGESVSAGRKTTAQEAYALNDTKNYLELEYYSNMFNSKYDCLFVLEW